MRSHPISLEESYERQFLAMGGTIHRELSAISSLLHRGVERSSHCFDLWDFLETRRMVWREQVLKEDWGSTYCLLGFNGIWGELDHPPCGAFYGLACPVLR